MHLELSIKELQQLAQSSAEAEELKAACASAMRIKETYQKDFERLWEHINMYTEEHGSGGSVDILIRKIDGLIRSGKFVSKPQA